MGNEIIKNYNLSEFETSRAGNNSFWKIYDGEKIYNETLHQISIWILTKDFLSPHESKIMEQIFHLMKKDFNIMKELSSDSHYLTIYEVIEDNRMNIAFVTERILGSLADIFTKFRGHPKSEELYSNYLESFGLLTEPEITRGFYDLSSSLHHLQTVTKRYHLNITPENIVLLPNGQWKLCGFGLSLSLQNDEREVPIPYFLPTMPSSMTVKLEPDECYLCPEIVRSPPNTTPIQYATGVSDIFSLGIVMYEAYHHFLFNSKRSLSHRPLLASPISHSGNSSNRDTIASSPSKLTILESIRRNVDSLPVSSTIRTLLLLMTDPNPSTRLTISDVLHHSLFQASPLSIYFQIDHLSKMISGISNQLEQNISKTTIPELSMFCSFPPAVGQLRPFILEHHFLPLLVKYTLQYSFLWEYSLPILVSVSSQLPASLFLQQTSQLFLSGFTTTNGDLIALMLQNMNFFLDLFSASYFNQYIVMLFYNAINYHSLPSLQSIAISIISDEKILSSIDITYYKQTLIPLVCHVICQQTDLTVKLHGIIFLKFILPTLEEEEEYIQTYILPTLQFLISSFTTPSTSSIDPVLFITILSVYKQISEFVSIDILCKDILIVLMPLLIVRSLSYDHYQYLVQHIQHYQTRIMESRKVEYTAPRRIDQKVKTETSSKNSQTISQQPDGEGISPATSIDSQYSSPSASSSAPSSLTSSSTSNPLTSIREEIQRTQREILKLQQELTVNSTPPIPSPQLPQSYFQSYPQPYDAAGNLQSTYTPYWGHGAINGYSIPPLNSSQYSSPQYSQANSLYTSTASPHHHSPYPPQPNHYYPPQPLQAPYHDPAYPSQSKNPFES